MKQKEKETIPAGRIRDLARQAEQNDYLTHTGFLSLSEQSFAAAETDLFTGKRDRKGGWDEASGKWGEAGPGLYGAARSVFYGGFSEADRKVLFFLPSYMDEEELIRREDSGEGILSCLRLTVRGARFTKEIGHRDCLGALMHLGIGREQIGDILIADDGSAAFIYVLSSMADHICHELITVGRAHVDLEIVPPSSCTVRHQLVERAGTVASVRIDSLIAMVFRLSRSAAQDLIAGERVFADGRTVTSSSWEPSPGCRISVRGHGKFIFDGEEKTTRKGRILVKTRVFS